MYFVRPNERKVKTMKNIKKILALVLAIMSIMTIAIPAFAESGTVDTSHGATPYGTVNYYSGYNTTASNSGLTKKGTLSNTSSVNVTPVNAHWYSFVKNGTTYYVMRQYVRVAGREWEIFYGTTELNLGSNNRYVRYLQQDLKTLGYLSGNVDGKYGSATRTAVRNFQTDQGLGVDGISGPLTKNALYNEAH